MWKSPIGKPSGSGLKHADANYRGYVYGSSTCESQTHLGDDFIPLSISTPHEDRRQRFGGWHRPRNNVHRQISRKPNAANDETFHGTYSAYSMQSTNSSYTRRKGGSKITRKDVGISKYVNMKYFLEDPWAEFAEKINKSKNNETYGTNHLPEAVTLVDRNGQPQQNLPTICDETLHDSGLSRESKSNILEESVTVNRGDTMCAKKVANSVNRECTEPTCLGKSEPVNVGKDGQMANVLVNSIDETVDGVN